MNGKLVVMAAVVAEAKRFYYWMVVCTCLVVVGLVGWSASRRHATPPVSTAPQRTYSREQLRALTLGKRLDEITPTLGAPSRLKEPWFAGGGRWEWVGVCVDPALGTLIVTVGVDEDGREQKPTCPFRPNRFFDSSLLLIENIRVEQNAGAAARDFRLQGDGVCPHRRKATEHGDIIPHLYHSLSHAHDAISRGRYLPGDGTKRSCVLIKSPGEPGTIS